MNEFLVNNSWAGDLLFGLSVVAVLAICIGGYFAFRALKKRSTDRIGKRGEKKVGKILDRFAARNNAYTLHDVYLPLYDTTTQIDHLLIGSFGILVVETKATGGSVYGNERDREWTHIIGNNRHKLYNPLKQNKAHVDCVNHHLKVGNLYKVRVDSLVVFAGADIEVHIPKGLPVITLDLLKKYLQKKQFHTDYQVDGKAVYNYLKSIQVTDRAKIKKHNQMVQKMAGEH